MFFDLQLTGKAFTIVCKVLEMLEVFQC